MEDEVTVPDGLPTLSYGPHLEGSGHACVMELVSVLAGERWSDQPSCTNRILSYIAQMINDDMTPDNRHRLIEIAPLLISTSAETASRESQLSDMLALRFDSLREDWINAQAPPISPGITVRFYNERGVETLKKLAQLCDEFNGYDRSAQEPTATLETLAEIRLRADAV